MTKTKKTSTTRREVIYIVIKYGEKREEDCEKSHIK
jgi:hypothetical protein